jgi:hypothetical protein
MSKNTQVNKYQVQEILNKVYDPDEGTLSTSGGNVASGATDSGNPVKVGGVYKVVPPVLTDGQRGDLQLDPYSNLRLITPSKIALARTVSASISASTTVTFNASTKMLRIYAIDKDVYLKWGATAVTAANFDEVIPANQVVDLYIPAETGTTLYTTMRIIERAATATVIIIEK